jgi:nucleoside-diphosphate-sugar epimerase
MPPHHKKQTLNSRDLDGVDESAPYAARPMDYYAATKIEGERLVLAAAGAKLAGGGRLAVTALRPSGIFGEHDALLVPVAVSKARAGKMKYIIGSGTNLMDWTYAGNVAAAHVLADAALAARGHRSAPAGRPYFITNADPRPFWGFMGDLLDGLGYGRPHIRLPFWPLFVIASLVAWVCAALRVVGVSIPPSDFTPARLRIAAATRRLSCDAAGRDFGYHPSKLVSVEEGLARTVAYFSHLRADVGSGNGSAGGAGGRAKRGKKRAA